MNQEIIRQTPLWAENWPIAYAVVQAVVILLVVVLVAAAAAEEHFREEWEKLNGKLTPKAKAELKEEAKEVAKEVSGEPLKETTTSAPAGEKGEPISAKAFSVKVRDTPTTITNKMFRPKTVKEYDPKSEQRKDAITRGLEAYEAAARNRK